MSAAAASAPVAAGAPVLALAGITKDYGTAALPVPVLRGLDVVVRAGEYVCVVGASGSGKSTLLHILGCLDRPTAGSYRLVGEDVARLDDARLSQVRKTRIGFVFQAFQLIPHLSVEENVELPLLYARQPKAVRRARSRALLDRVGLGHRLHHLPTELSGGECQRAAIARALVNEPALVLADEPTGNLDSKTAAEILRLFGELHAAGATIVMITHDRAVAAAAGRRIVLCDGRIESDDGASAAGEAACSAN